MGWKTRVLLDTLKAFLPFQNTLRRLKRRWQPYRTEADIDAFAYDQGLEIVEVLRKSGISLEGKTALELGTGWHPLIPLLLRLAGCSKVILTDVVRLTDAELVRSACRYLAERRDTLITRCGIDPAAFCLVENVPAGLSLEALLATLQMEYRVPFRSEDLANTPVDLVTSRTVLEHVRPQDLTALLAGFRQALRPGGVMCHVIDMSDHFEHRDKSISRVNFLKYNNFLWSITGLNPQNYQNRLRHYEFTEMFRAAGFKILREIAEPDPTALAELQSMHLCQRYAGEPKRRLAVITSLVLASPA